MDELDAPTLGELVRQVAELKREFADGQRAIFQKLDVMDGTYVRRDVYLAEQEAARVLVVNVNEKVLSLQDTNKWLWRAVAGVGFSILIGLVMMGVQALAK